MDDNEKDKKSKTNGAVGSLEELLSLNKPEVRRVYNPHLKRDFFIRKLSLAGATLINEFYLSIDGDKPVGSVHGFREAWVGMALCNEKGEGFFTTLDECMALTNFDSEAMIFLFNEVNKINLVTDDQKEEAKKKSETTAPS